MKKKRSETNDSQFTTVKTGYARIAVLLLAINFCLTGYVVYSMTNTMQSQIDTVTGGVQAQPREATRTEDDTQTDQTDQTDQTKE